jgi:hypothetical protein
MIKHCFIVTSAVNSKFGIYSPAERLAQTVITLQNIKFKIPDAKIIVMECGGNWDVVKNSTEIMCFGRLLRLCLIDGDFEGYDRIHKMSGRYILNDDFNLDVYKQYADQIIIGPKHQSQFPFQVTGIELQYMARLWSWPLNLLDTVIKVYEDSLIYIGQRVSQGGYADIEHVLYKFLPSTLVKEIPVLGVEGFIAPNGVPIKN